jgi:AmmeMemoRadiSam system protein A
MQTPVLLPLLTLDRRRALLEHAARTLRAVAAGGGVPAAPEALAADPAFATHHCCFVTLRRPDGALRGCIGTFGGDDDLVSAVGRMTAQAARFDPRFAPVRAPECDALRIGVSVLTPRLPCDDLATIVPGRHGVEIERDGRRGVFLPQVATEQRWGRERLLAELCRKAGLPADAWAAPDARLRTFEALVFGDDHGDDA